MPSGEQRAVNAAYDRRQPKGYCKVVTDDLKECVRLVPNGDALYHSSINDLQQNLSRASATRQARLAPTAMTWKGTGITGQYIATRSVERLHS